MPYTTQIKLPLKELLIAESPDEWTFNGAPTRELTHCYHDYPARMIPQVAGKLLDKFGRGAKLMFDPYCGTGTSLAEAMVRGINAKGTDLNPLARLIAEAKTSIINRRTLDTEIESFYKHLTRSKSRGNGTPPKEILGITRLGFWFKPQVIERLAFLKRYIDDIGNSKVRLFFQVAFSETVRDASNTRSEEFKLYRYDAERLRRFDPDVFAIMSQKLKRNRNGLEGFLDLIERLTARPSSNIYDFNTVSGVPLKKIAPASIDIVITSPPYGDSHTTVAYGQYSRLSAAWLSLNEPHRIDNALMGGKIHKEIPRFPSEQLNQALNAILEQDKKRGAEVASFYTDLERSISNIAPLIRAGGHTCYVIGNRKVKGVPLPTDDAIGCFFETHGFVHVDTFHRSIPNKRMPLKNSPTNAPGVLDSTMTREYIVVMRRP